jgi:hypothetical protein
MDDSRLGQLFTILPTDGGALATKPYNCDMKRYVFGGLVMLLTYGFGSLAAQGQLPVAPQGRAGGGQSGGVGRDQREQPTGTAMIRGRVLSTTGSPIRRAQVRANAAGLRASRLTTTDADGRFELRDLPAGRWDLTASKAGFVALRYGQRRPFESGRPVELGNGQRMERVDFSLPRGSAVTGHVFDEFGEPVANARVQILRYQMAQGSRRLSPIGVSDQSDDTGAFRLYGLAPGDYYVSATLRAVPADDGSNETTSYAPTYYPGTDNVADAQRISLSIGDEQSNINFALMPIRTVRVSGAVFDAAGNPLTAGFVTLIPTADRASGLVVPPAGSSRVRANGTFMLTNVSPGSYTLTASTGPRRGSPDLEFASVPVTVDNEDLSGLSVVTHRGATLTGTLVAADGSSGQLRTSGVQVVAQSARLGQPGPGSRPSPVASDGSFRLTNLAGQRLIRVNGLPQAWMLKAITLNGADVIDTPLEFGANQAIVDVQVVVTDQLTEVNGKVSLRGEAIREYTVVVFSADSEKWLFPTRYVRSGRADQQGLFKIRALPPGQDYLAVAVDYLEDGEDGDPRFLEQIKGTATPFKLAAGESKALDLQLVER